MRNPKIQHWQGLRVWLIGASSGIGAALAKQLADRGARVALSARRLEQLELLKQGLLPVEGGHLCLALDVTRLESLQSAEKSLQERWQGFDLVIWLAGDYSPLDSQAFDLNRALQITDINYIAVLKGLHTVLPSLLNPPIATKTRAERGLVLVSSVAGFRGLPKALAYGPSKAALINLAEILFLELAPKGLGVWLINPGFVATPLTANNPFKMPALMQPDEAATAIIQGLARGAFEIHFPKRFTRWLKLGRMMPYRLYFWAIRHITKA